MTISSLLQQKLRAALEGLADVEPQLTPGDDARFGDYQTNVAMVLAKPLRANPRQLAQQIIEKLDVAEICDPPEIAGAGFINFRLRADWLAKRFAAFTPRPKARRALTGRAAEARHRLLFTERGEADARRPHSLDDPRRCARADCQLRRSRSRAG
jgi:arginyl-tRNA synthetase